MIVIRGGVRLILALWLCASIVCTIFVFPLGIAMLVMWWVLIMAAARVGV